MLSQSYVNQQQKCSSRQMGFGRVFIAGLPTGVVRNKLVGLVITKFEPRSFPDKQNLGQFKFQMTFVLRDTDTDYINVSCWGHEEFIMSICMSFKVGGVVEIENFMVQLKQNTEYEQLYRPTTSSPFRITVNELYSTVKQFEGGDISSEFTHLACMPVVEPNDYYTLGDIITNGQSLNGDSLNILAVIKDIGLTKNITTKSGHPMKRKELKLFDETCMGFPFIIWDSEVAELASTWHAKETVVFLCDVKVTFDDFRQQMVATSTSKTIIITNPDTVESHHLYNYSKTIPSFHNSTFDDVPMSDLMLSDVIDVYTISDLEKRKNSGEMLCGILYACVTYFDIDGNDGNRCVTSHCASCNRRVNRDTEKCIHCGENITSTSFFEIFLSLSDHTGGLAGFILARDTAAKVLDCDSETFLGLSALGKTELKWQFLMERFKVYFKVKPSMNRGLKTFITVLAMEHSDPIETIQYSAKSHIDY